jgi:putative iron-dependent peroxidase
VPYLHELAVRQAAILLSMKTPQAGIFALGTASHAYLEFDLLDQGYGEKLVAAISALREPRTTIGGVNLVAGFRPELWSEIAPNEAPSGVHGFNLQIAGKEGFKMPATQHDALLWILGSAYDVVFDVAREAIRCVMDVASAADETSSWPYRHDRDLTGFIDGSENPSLIDASEAALIQKAIPGRADQFSCCRSGSTIQWRGSLSRSIGKSK